MKIYVELPKKGSGQGHEGMKIHTARMGKRLS